ncbi:LOW QUALITY PROTEIN: LOB domain-containing protein 15 isoform X1 [Populus alba x Populus x berolinensis]|nr:LOW QUALITY PROTEIN: LOB domain-containing protein 15 isoform X1 [Populus alba x Populus x berolinensis]
MLTSSSNHPQKSLKLKQDDKKVFSRRLARDVSLSNMSTEDYHVGASVAVPFTWESQPGTPKIKFREHPLPPLTPPPSYSYNNPKRPTKKLSKYSLLDSILPKRSARKANLPVSPAFSSSSSYQYLHGQQHVLCLLRQRRERFEEIGKRIKRESDASSLMGRRQMLGPPGILNTVTPCAACKLLRRRCAEECPFSPYFSPLEPQKFAAVHKVFGASNVSKLLMEVPESQRADAANSLVYEANLRLRDPVYGSMGAISALQQQIQLLQAELRATRADILNYKYREAAASNIISSTHAALVSSAIASISAPSQTLAPPPPPPPTPPPLSVVVSLSTSSPSLYTPPTSTSGPEILFRDVGGDKRYGGAVILPMYINVMIDY